jgi:hypothetical protein
MLIERNIRTAQYSAILVVQLAAVFDAPSIMTQQCVRGRQIHTTPDSFQLIARDDLTNSPYAPLTFPPEYFTLYPINLHSLRTHARAVWPGLKLPAWLGWLAGHWGIEAHLRVALRKLRSQNQDTFHILPSEQGLKVAAMPEPTYTSPY